jgi:integrase
MKAKLTNRTVASLKPQERSFDVRDTDIKGFLIRVRPTGSMTYLLQYRNSQGLQRHFKIGTVGDITPVQARDIAAKKAAEIAGGKDIQAVRKQARVEGGKARYQTLKGFLDGKYGPWVTEHRRNHKETLSRICRNFGFLHDRSLTEINTWVIEKWRAERLKKGVTKETLNRDIAALKAAISKAVDWDIIQQHPLTKLKPLKLDRTGKVRYLTDKEETSLRQALLSRDNKIRFERDSFNEWRRHRGYAPLPSLHDRKYADHLSPIVLLTLNTGLRRGEIFNLKWEHINFHTKTLTVQGATAKSGETRHLPLNGEAIEVLKEWRKQSDHEQVFPGNHQNKLTTIKTAWRTLMTEAKIKNFRFHDLRHNFASNLVMKGALLNTVRELLGHADLKTTLRYAHLAPDHKAEAVELLNKRLWP